MEFADVSDEFVDPGLSGAPFHRAEEVADLAVHCGLAVLGDVLLVSDPGGEGVDGAEDAAGGLFFVVFAVAAGAAAVVECNDSVEAGGWPATEPGAASFVSALEWRGHDGEDDVVFGELAELLLGAAYAGFAGVAVVAGVAGLAVVASAARHDARAHGRTRR
jgi:hypothetical protein